MIPDEYGRFEVTTEQDKAYDVVETFLDNVTGDVEKVDCRIRYKLPLQGEFTYLPLKTEDNIADMKTELESQLGTLYGYSPDYIAVIWIIVHKQQD